MSQIRRIPYMRPDSSRWKLGEWHLVQNGITEPIQILLPHWEPALPIQASVSIHLDIAGILADCNLDEGAELRAGLLWYSPGTVLRNKGSVHNLDSEKTYEEVLLSCEIEGIQLAKNVELSAVVTLSSPNYIARPFAPKIPGSILLQSEPILIALQGQGAKFPVEVLDFGSTAYPNDAAWVLYWDPDNLHQTVLGDLRLYFNSRHKQTVQAVSENRPEDFALREAIRFDIARTLIYGVLKNAEFVKAPEIYEAGTIGAAMRSMLRFYFPDIPFSQLQVQSQQTQFFEPKLQASLKAFWRED